ncbi:hypothetical protein [Flammeovirga sp. OC4]|uniref:hypothetical protein n=1 Tax=Flammeovirga sp. OC4 TaxID=1382345 RepID=UPI0005C61AF4|nr:hypothetical protein [Flammeovirga sp. OC4]
MLKQTHFFRLLIILGILSLYSCSEDEGPLDPIKGKWQVSAINATETETYELRPEKNNITYFKADNISSTYEFMDENILEVRGKYDRIRYDEEGNELSVVRDIPNHRTDYWEINEDMSEFLFAIDGTFLEERWEITELTTNKITKKSVVEIDIETTDGPINIKIEVIIELTR